MRDVQIMVTVSLENGDAVTNLKVQRAVQDAMDNLCDQFGSEVMGGWLNYTVKEVPEAGSRFDPK